MGGYGSTRWKYHHKKTTVENCLKLNICVLKEYLFPYGRGSISWTRGSSISFMVTGREDPEAIQLEYKRINSYTGEVTHYAYPIPVTYTPTPWGARRYWFTCPLAGCGRRVGVLYLPPGASYFGCRHCYNLTYTSAQEAGKWDGLYPLLAEAVQEYMPDTTAEGAGMYDPYSDYLTLDELLQQSGLSADSLAALESARLLLPDHEGKYRPKLAGWGRKLATLLGEGWTIDELKAWARGRWSTPNPRVWPPRRDDWSGRQLDI